MKSYCQQCGHGQTHGSTKPRFCSQCGVPIGIYSEQKENYKFDESLDIEEDPSNFKIGNMTALQVDIEPLNIPKQTLGSIIKSQPEGELPPKMDKIQPLIENQQSSEEFLESFRKEAGTNRQNY